MKINELKRDLSSRIVQVKQRVIRRLEDDAVLALLTGDEREAMGILAKIELIKGIEQPIQATDLGSPEWVQQRQLRRSLRSK